MYTVYCNYTWHLNDQSKKQNNLQEFTYFITKPKPKQKTKWQKMHQLEKSELFAHVTVLLAEVEFALR